MEVPDDLTVEIRSGKVILASKGRYVELEISRRGGGIFFDGPVKWSELERRYLEPALYQLTRPK
jgi:hypothetical protein